MPRWTRWNRHNASPVSKTTGQRFTHCSSSSWTSSQIVVPVSHRTKSHLENRAGMPAPRSSQECLSTSRNTDLLRSSLSPKPPNSSASAPRNLPDSKSYRSAVITGSLLLPRAIPVNINPSDCSLTAAGSPQSPLPASTTTAGTSPASSIGQATVFLKPVIMTGLSGSPCEPFFPRREPPAPPKFELTRCFLWPLIRSQMAKPRTVKSNSDPQSYQG